MSDSTLLYTKCPECSGTGNVLRGRSYVQCPECRGEHYSPIEVTLEQLSVMIRELAEFRRVAIEAAARCTPS